tara:strand:+ start:2332 stop:2763 length:432 start_codon:yes stop_codon:yes gene_type:complete
VDTLTKPTDDKSVFIGHRERKHVFNKIGIVKTTALLALLNAGLDVLISDVDVVWLNSPAKYFKSGQVRVVFTNPGRLFAHTRLTLLLQSRRKTPKSWFPAIAFSGSNLDGLLLTNSDKLPILATRSSTPVCFCCGAGGNRWIW